MLIKRKKTTQKKEELKNEILDTFYSHNGIRFARIMMLTLYTFIGVVCLITLLCLLVDLEGFGLRALLIGIIFFLTSIGFLPGIIIYSKDIKIVKALEEANKEKNN